jgi:hypothetical protein
VGRLPVPSIISVEYMSILLSPVIEIDVSECVYWDCASIVRSTGITVRIRAGTATSSHTGSPSTHNEIVRIR